MRIYAIHSNSSTCKIGFSNDPEKRLLQLQTGSPEKLSLTYEFEPEFADIEKLENKIHKELSHKRLRGEWFKLNEKEATDILIFASISWDKKFLE